jgi:hypothetical protein
MYKSKSRVKVKMKTEGSGRRSLGYGVGSLAVLVVSIGVAAVTYSVSLISFNLLNIPAWILGPFGLYTIIYAFVTGRDLTYYLAWGTIMFAIGLASALYTMLNPFIVFGILLIILAVIGLAAYWRGKK